MFEIGLLFASVRGGVLLLDDFEKWRARVFYNRAVPVAPAAGG